MPVTQPIPPPVRHGSSQSDCPLKTENFVGEKRAVSEVTLPAFAQVSFTPAILGCSASFERMSTVRSMPAFTPGNCEESACQMRHCISHGALHIIAYDRYTAFVRRFAVEVHNCIVSHGFRPVARREKQSKVSSGICSVLN